MDLPGNIQKEVDKVFDFHEKAFLNAAHQFETARDMSLRVMMETLIIDSMGIHKNMKVKHIIILFAIGQAMIAKGFQKEKVKKCQIKILLKYYSTELIQHLINTLSFVFD